MDSQEDLSTNTSSLSGWALVNSQGELIQSEADSDTSESSIEVVSVQDKDIVSFHQARRERSGCDEGDRRKSEYQSEEAVTDVLRSVTSVKEKTKTVPHTGSKEERVVIGAYEVLSSFTPLSSNDLVETSHDTSQGPRGDKTDQSLNDAENGNGKMEKDSDVEGEKIPYVPKDSLSLTHFIGTVIEDYERCESPQSQGSKPENGLGTLYFSPDSKITLEYLDGACCKELLSVTERHKIEVGVQEKTDDSAYPDDEENIGHEKGREVTNPALDNGSETSSDSDFVRLDPENLENFGDINYEADVTPMLIHRSRSSIDDSFRFMRAQDVSGPVIQPLPAFNNAADDNDAFDGDIDRDDETESSTEEGTDDRIESEQSEAGSHIAVNDVGDLSAFADIGDIPLVVGDVRRNYIHRPNNHLSSVLNISLLLAAILTTGISLGIIMATDLEIEEWQNAYELQTMRVKQLELQLHEKKSLLETQDAKVLQLKGLSNQLKLRLAAETDKTHSHGKTEKALDYLEARGIIEGGHLSHAVHLLRGVIQVFIHCEEDLNNIDSDNDNGSVTQASVCYDQLEDFIAKLRGLTDVGSPPLIGQNIFKPQKEGWYKNTVTDSFEIQDVKNVKESEKVTNNKGTKYVDENVEKHPFYDQNTDTDVLMESGESHRSISERKTNSAKKVQGQGVVDIDIRRLQQSLSREQERALHWQHLYLLERRQRERERENEEWEDERDREEWEKEWKNEREEMERSKVDINELECLKKILASNLTTLTQHVAKWNISVLDDFANLSILISSVQDLKLSVVNSINNVWGGAEEVLESLESASTENAESLREIALALRHYLLEVIHSIQKNSGPQLERLLASLQDSLEKLKQSFEAMRHDVNSDSVAYWIEHAWTVTEDIIGKLQNNFGKLVPEKEVLMIYLRNLSDSLELKNSDENIARRANAETFEEEYDMNKQDLRDDEEILNSDQFVIKSSSDDDFEDFKNEDKEHELDDDGNDEDEDDDDNEEEEDYAKENLQNTKDESGWSLDISNILSRTHKSFQQLGQKVSRTFCEIKTIWHKKDMPLIRIAKHLTSKFMRASVKLTKMCTKLPTTFFKGNTGRKDEDQVLIYSKCIKKLRKQWQKQLFKNPCDIAGMLSPECNSDRKTLKKELKEVSKLFSQLLRIKTFQPEEALKLSKDDAALHYELFKSFLERWGGRSMLLKKDLQWAACQRNWWLKVFKVLIKSNREGNELTLNNCDILTHDESYFPGGSAEEVGKLKIKKAKQKKKKTNFKKDDDEGNERIRKKLINDESSLNDGQEHQMNNSKAGVNAGDESSSKWFDEKEKHRVQHKLKKNFARNSHGKSKKQTSSSKSATNEQNLIEDPDQRKNDWFLKKAQYREYQREKHSKSEWLFERARHRRHDTWHGRNLEQRKIHNKRHDLREENWTLKHGHYRQQQREEEHRADWVFDRAADRKDHHDSALLDCHHQKYSKKKKYFDKEFRCAYGKVSSP